MGFSKMHSTQVGLVLNVLTGSISPQYHVVFDDMLSTVMISTAVDPEFWLRLVILNGIPGVEEGLTWDSAR